jgi:hypothetical protein
MAGWLRLSPYDSADRDDWCAMCGAQVRYYNHSQPWCAPSISRQCPAAAVGGHVVPLLAVANQPVAQGLGAHRISHISLQGHDVQQLDMAKAVWTQKTPKPIVWDEVMYEGNISYAWGGLSAYTETRRAWTALTNQVALAGHSNTALLPHSFEECMAKGLDPGRVVSYFTPIVTGFYLGRAVFVRVIEEGGVTQECNAVMWWNKGDVLRGESPPRLEWYKRYVGGELGVKVPALDDTTCARLNGVEEAGVFELYHLRVTSIQIEILT